MAETLILVVDDDPHITEVVEFALTAAGYVVVTAGSGEKALEMFRQHSPALVVLDINLPDRDGLWVCQRIRETSQAPVLFLSARDEEVDRVMGLTIGGDDYVTKPFSPRELTARVQAILRRGAARPDKEENDGGDKWTRGQLRLDIEAHTAFWGGDQIDLTATEFQILKTMLGRPSKVFTRDELLDIVYQDTVVSDRTIDSHILHIRKKFGKKGGKDVVQTQHGVGYKLG
ncbi:response regulator transcription factor [Deltaproteobacteria bacterium OttesenSCG-928-K17]|nr:response regulator transcription factor [Deltaproteobacteria bacterium OttesenSCG-928-K17]